MSICRHSSNMTPGSTVSKDKKEIAKYFTGLKSSRCQFILICILISFDPAGLSVRWICLGRNETFRMSSWYETLNVLLYCQQVDLELIQLGVQRGRGTHHMRQCNRSQVRIPFFLPLTTSELLLPFSKAPERPSTSTEINRWIQEERLLLFLFTYILSEQTDVSCKEFSKFLLVCLLLTNLLLAMTK